MMGIQMMMKTCTSPSIEQQEPGPMVLVVVVLLLVGLLQPMGSRLSTYIMEGMPQGELQQGPGV
jgi:hypothetical protein